MENTGPKEIHNSSTASHGASPPPRPRERKENFLGDIFRFALIAFIIVVPIRLFIAQPFIVQGASMQPAFDSGQYLIVDQLSYRFEAPARGEVVIFRHPNMSTTFLIKRIVGLPGETVSLGNQSVRISGGELPEGFILEEPYLEGSDVRYQPLTVTLKENEYFVLGDNRNASSDSRSWGVLEERFIVGRALLRLLPLSQTEVFPGDHRE